MSAPFTSTLSATDLALVRGAGLRPLRQVLGTCTFQRGWQRMPLPVRRGGSVPAWGGPLGQRIGWPRQEVEVFELDQLTAAWNDARQRALDAMAGEAAAAGADAVVDVRLRRRGRPWAVATQEIVATGTAVRSERYELGDTALLSNLSAGEMATLLAHGHWPVGLVAGSTVSYVTSTFRQRQRTLSLRGGLRNQELEDFSVGMHEARRLSVGRLERQAHALHAHGVVGLRMEHTLREREAEANGASYTDLIVEMHALGTAIVEVEHDGPPPPKYVALSMDSA